MDEIEMKIEKWPISSLDVNVRTPYSLYVNAESVIPKFFHAAMATPVAINPNQIEYCRGELDKDKNQYGVRIHFVSGNTLWLPGDIGEKFMHTLQSTCSIARHESTKRNLVDKYNEKKAAQ